MRQPCPPYTLLFPSETTATGGIFPVYEYRMQMEIGPTYSSWMAADQQARDATYDQEQQYTSDTLYAVPARAIRSQAATAADQLDKVSLAAFQPAGVPRLFVLSGYAGVSRELAAKLMRRQRVDSFRCKIG